MLLESIILGWYIRKIRKIHSCILVDTYSIKPVHKSRLDVKPKKEHEL